MKGNPHYTIGRFIGLFDGLAILRQVGVVPVGYETVEDWLVDMASDIIKEYESEE